MKIKDVMTRGVECARPENTLRELASRMTALDVGALPVCENEKLIGMVTDRDIVLRAVARGLDPMQTRARDVMSPDVQYCFDDSDIEDCASMMSDHQIRRLVVLDRNKRLVGIVSLGDLATGVHKDKLTGETLEAISRSGQPQR